MSGTMRGSLTVRGAIALVGLTAGLCAVFALIVSAVDGWREHRQERWPEATATIVRCDVNRTDPYRQVDSDSAWLIECQISYRVGSDQKVETRIRSRSTQSRRQTVLMNQWTNDHQSGSIMAIHYDPADHNTAALIQTDMPGGGPRAPSDLRLAIVFSILCVSLLGAAKILQRRTR